MGGVALGNEFEFVTDEGAHDALAAAWRAGVRYFDVAPWYGLGLAERRYGQFLHNQERDSYLLSTKVGKLLRAAPQNNSKGVFPFANSPNNVIFEQNAPLPKPGT
jgi:D-threo-aldose 1-dehydrogenase